MAKRVQQQKASTEAKQEVEEVVEPTVSENAEAIKAELDELLDEIDGLLETNAEEFVKGFIQKGGQ